MFKKAFILLLSAALLCASFTVVSSAADICKIGLEYTAEGDTLSLTVTYSDFSDPDGIVAVSSNVYFDKSVLEFQSVEPDMPEEWGECADDWSKLYADGNVLICILFNSPEENHGTTKPITCTVNFKILSKGVDTLVEVKNTELTESGELHSLTAPNTSLTVSISESGEVSGDVSEEEISVPEESEEVSVPEGSETVDESKDESKESESSVPSTSDTSTGENDGGNNTVVWIIVGVAVVAIAAVVTVVVMKKKN